MTTRDSRQTGTTAQGFELPIDCGMLRRVIDSIASIGSPNGHRAIGTPEEREVTEIVAAEMRGIGLANVNALVDVAYAWLDPRVRPA